MMVWVKKLIKDDGVRAFFDGLYQECAQSRRAQSTKSNQIMMTYLAMVAAYCTCLSSIPVKNFKVWLASGIFVSIFGIGCIASLLNLRSWKIQYTRCCAVLGKMIICDDELSSYEEITEFILLNYENKKERLRRNVLKSLDHKIILAFSIIALFPAFFAVTINAKWNVKHIIIFGIILVIYILIILGFLHKTEKKAYGRKMTWIIDFSGIIGIGRNKADGRNKHEEDYKKYCSFKSANHTQRR